MTSAYAVRRPVVNAYLVRERDRRRLRELALGARGRRCRSALGLLAYTWLQLETLRTGYRIDDARARGRTGLAQVERQLRLEAAYLAQPGAARASAPARSSGCRRRRSSRSLLIEETRR